MYHSLVVGADALHGLAQRHSISGGVPLRMHRHAARRPHDHAAWHCGKLWQKRLSDGEQKWLNSKSFRTLRWVGALLGCKREVRTALEINHGRHTYAGIAALRQLEVTSVERPENTEPVQVNIR